MASNSNSNRIGITFSEEDNRRFMALAEMDNKKPATLAAEIILAFMDKRAGEIDSILKAKDEYEKKIAGLRAKNDKV